MSMTQLLSSHPEHRGTLKEDFKRIRLVLFTLVFLFSIIGIPAHSVQAAPTPLITVTANLTNFYALAGSPSAAQTYTVAGSNLAGDITITAPTGYELSLNNSTYTTSLTPPRSNKTVSTTTVYVRLTGTAVGTFSGNVTHTTINPNTGQNIVVNLAVSGMVGNCWQLTVGRTGEGTAPTASPARTPACPSDGQYFAGFNISLTGAAPSTGWFISGWTGTSGDTLTSNTNSLIMPASAHSASVNYTAYNYTLTVTSAHGTVTRSPDQAYYHYGDVVTLGVAPEPGWTFTGWTPALTNNQVTIQGDTAVTANFTQDEYTLTINSAHGPVTRYPDQVTYHYGDVVTLTMGAVEPGWTFTGWMPALTTNQVTILDDTTVTAGFTQDEYTLTVNSDHGTVTRDPDQVTYHYGEIVTLSMSPSPGWTFTGWTPSLSANQVTIFGNTTVTANFTQNEYTLTINSAYGPVTKSPDQVTYHYGDVVTLSMGTVDPGWTFSGWTPTLINNQLTIQGDITVTANFTQDEYTLTVNSAYGTVSRSPDQATYHYGDVVTLTMGTVEPGWTFTGWSPALTSNQVTIHGNTTVTAGFIQNEYTLTVTSAHGTVNRSPDQETYHYGDVVTLSMTPEPGWTFTGWTPTLTANQVTIHGNTTVAANFTQNEYNLTINSSHGTATRSPDQTTYHYGDVVTLAMTNMDAGWIFTGWTPSLTANQVTILGDTTVTANFTQIEYSLTINSDHGTVIRTPDQAAYHYGDVVALSMAADAGWTFTGWTPVLTNSEVTILSDTTITANFTQNEYTLTINADHGTVTRAPEQATYHYGDVVTLTIQAVEHGWAFAGWTPELINNQVTIQGDTIITANFNSVQPDCFVLTISHTGQGSSPTAVPTKSALCPADGQYEAGEIISLSGAVPSYGWEINGWTGTDNDSSKASTNMFTMPAADKIVSVTYIKTPFYLYLPLISFVN